MRPVSMMISNQEKVERSEEYKEGVSPENMEDYPYGLRISLRHEDLQKLGMAREGLKAGDKIALAGIAIVTSVDATQVNTAIERSAQVQITDLMIEAAPEEKPRANIMYGATANV